MAWKLLTDGQTDFRVFNRTEQSIKKYPSIIHLFYFNSKTGRRMFGKFSYDGLFIDDFEKEKFQEYTMNKNNNFKKFIKCIIVYNINHLYNTSH